MLKLVDDAWHGKTVYVVGGGPSLNKFTSGKLERFGLDGRLVIGVNLAFTKCVCRIVYIGDWNVLDLCEKDPELSLYDMSRRDRRFVKVVPVELLRRVPDPEAFRFLGVKPTARPGLDLAPWGESFGTGAYLHGDSGLAALNIAAILGAGQVYLLGFDMSADDRGDTVNFHSKYPYEWRQGRGYSYEDYLDTWTRVIPEHIRARVTVVGESRLDIFEKISIEEFEGRKSYAET